MTPDMRKKLGLAALGLLGVALLAWLALIIDRSVSRHAMIDAQFKMCADEGRCGYMSWTMTTAGKGWRTKGTFVSGDLVSHWNDSCSDGRYEATFNDRHYKGTCSATRTESGPCLAMDSVVDDGHETMKLIQCFSIAGATCKIHLKGRILSSGSGNNGQSKEYRLTPRNAFSCAVSSI